MISYLPELYTDELVYSAMARYFAHTYSSYIYAIEDFCESKNDRIDVELGTLSLNIEVKNLLDEIYGLENILLNHTMFPQYGRFSDVKRKEEAIEILMSGDGDIHQIIQFQTNNKEKRYLRFCPICSKEDREHLGETYWHRIHQIRGVNICTRHCCKLLDSNVEISSKKSPRLWVADAEIPEANFAINCIDEKEIKFAKYVIDVFVAPISINNISISEYLISRLEGTKYISVRGEQKYIGKLFNDIKDFYKNLGDVGITKQHQIQKIFMNRCTNFYKICQLGYFLNINVEELTNPTFPAKSQTERFDEKVEELYSQGLGSHRIARLLGVSSRTVLDVRKEKEKKHHDYSIRKGMHKQDWDKLDEESIVAVKSICEDLYSGDDSRPKRVTEFAICRAMGWPNKRLDYLPLCREVIHSFEESIEEYWARECVWTYNKLESEKENVNWRKLRDITNLRRSNFDKCKKYISKHTDYKTAKILKNLI